MDCLMLEVEGRVCVYLFEFVWRLWGFCLFSYRSRAGGLSAKGKLACGGCLVLVDY